MSLVTFNTKLSAHYPRVDHHHKQPREQNKTLILKNGLNFKTDIFKSAAGWATPQKQNFHLRNTKLDTAAENQHFMQFLLLDI